MELHKEVSLSQSLLREYSSLRNDWATQAKDSEMFAEGAQWEKADVLALKEAGQVPIVVNCIFPAVEQATAMLTTNKPRFSSTGKEDSDAKVGKIFSELMSYIWDISDGNSELKQVIKDAYVKGQSYLQIYFDPNEDFGKGEIFIKSIDPYDVFIDPNSKEKFLEDSANILVAKLITKEQVLRMYPELQGNNSDGSAIIDSLVQSTENMHPSTMNYGAEGQTYEVMDLYHKSYQLIDRYTKVKLPTFKLILEDNNYEKVVEDANELQQIFEKTVFISQDEQGTRTYVIDDEKVAGATDMYNKTGGQFYYIQDQNGQPQLQTGNPQEVGQQQAEQMMQDPNVQMAIQQGQMQPPNGMPMGYMQGSYTQLYPATFKDLIENQIITLSTIYQNRIKRVLSIGNYLVYNNIMGKLSTYPIKRLVFRHNRSPYPQSDVMAVKGLQQYINKIRSLIVAHAQNNTNIKIMVPKGSVNAKEFEKKLRKAGSALLEVDMELGVPQPLYPQPLPNELYKNEADARRDIQEILGIYPFMQGDNNNAPDTYKGTVALDEFANRRIKSRKDDIEAMLNQLGKIAVEFIQMFYTDYKVFRLLRPNNIERSTAINVPIYDDVTKEYKGKINDVTIGQYDIIVVSGSMLPSNRWSMLEYYQNLYKEGIIDQVEVLKKTEVADMEGVLERFGHIQQMQQQLQQLSEENKNLKGDMQTLQRQNVNLLQKNEVVNFQHQVGVQSDKVKQSQIMYSERLNDSQKLHNQKLDLELKKIQIAGKELTKKRKNK